MSTMRVAVTGADKWQAQCRQMRGDMPIVVRETSIAGARFIVSKAIPRIPVLTGAARSSVRIVTTSTGSSVEAGGSGVPYYGWLDFGGSVGRNGSIKRTYIRTGRYIFRAIADNSQKIQELAEEALVTQLNAIGLEPK